jgi:hypothetical protein
VALSDTARLISSLELQDKFSQTAKAGEQALGGLESKSNFVSRGFGLMGQAGGAVGNAFGTLKGRIGQLISGPLGMIGLGAGLFGIGKFLTDAVSDTRDFAKEVGRLAALTGLGTEQTSRLAGAFHHFGIETDQVLTIVGFAEKTLGKLTATGANAEKQADDLASAQRDLTLAQLKLNEANARYSSGSSQVLTAQNRVADAQDALNQIVEDGGVIVGGAAGFFNKYGLALTDASGKTKDFNALLLDSADFFNNKSIPAETKAAALATIYGKSWQTLIPILSAGRQGISDAEDEAAALGLTLTKDNLSALAKLKTATRDWGTALGGLKLQLGLAVIPLLTDLTTGAFNFLKTADRFGVTGSQKIVGFFKDVITFGEKAFGIIQDRVVPIVKKVIDGWNALPEPLKGLLVKGVAGNFAIKFLLGFDPIAIAGAAAGAVAGKIAGAAAGAVTGAFGSFIGDFFGRTAAQKLIPSLVTLTPGITPIPVLVTNPGFGLPGPGGPTPIPTPTTTPWWLTPLRFLGLGATALGVGEIAGQSNVNTDTQIQMLRQQLLATGDVKDALNKSGATLGAINEILAHPDLQTGLSPEILDALDAIDGKMGDLVTNTETTATNTKPFKSQLPGAPGGGHPAAQLVKLDDAALIAALAKTSEFGFRGIGTAIEHGILAGTDPFGKQALALFQRAEFPRQGKTLGEIERHIIAAEDAQAQFAAKGDTAAVKQLQATIDGLRALLTGTDKIYTITHAEAQKRADTANRLNRLLDPLPGGIRALVAKDFKPTVNVRVTTNTSVSVSNVVRTINSYTVAIGSGPGGALDASLL